MADKILKTRISLKYDALNAWEHSTLILNKGEVAIATIPVADTDNKQLPPVMFKVGDGTHTFSELDWASGLAADVYGWAKAKTKPSYTPAEVGADVAGAAATAEANAKAYTDEQIAAIPQQAEYTLETGATDGSLVLKKDGKAVGDPAVVEGWADLLTKAQQGVDDAATAQAAAEAAQTAAETAQAAAETAQAAATKAQGDIDAYKTSNDAALAAVKKTADAAQTSAQVDTKISTHNTSTEAHADIRGEITALSEKVSGRATNYVYKNDKDADYIAAVGKAGSFIVGDTIYFTDTNISDQWVIKVNAAAPYYEFQDIETEKPSFDGYVKGTGLTADKLVLGNTGSNVKASAYGISETLTSTDNVNLPTSKAVADYVGGQLDNLDATKVSATAAQTISSIEQINGKIIIGAAQDIKIAQSQVTGLDTALGGKQDKIDATHPLSADFVSGLGDAAKKGVDATVSATSENLPTSKAVASYVGGEIGKIVIPTVNNAALRDASEAIIFTANASADVKITVIDCGNASGWDA